MEDDTGDDTTRTLEDLDWRSRDEVEGAVQEGRAVSDARLAAVAVAHARRTRRVMLGTVAGAGAFLPVMGAVMAIVAGDNVWRAAAAMSAVAAVVCGVFLTISLPSATAAERRNRALLEGRPPPSSPTAGQRASWAATALITVWLAAHAVGVVLLVVDRLVDRDLRTAPLWTMHALAAPLYLALGWTVYSALRDRAG